uniref:Uncharacterized protein n=1 Tax=Ditylenchus dipsaci TaxID=166011 RepID=A0A915DFW5_9BILA
MCELSHALLKYPSKHRRKVVAGPNLRSFCPTDGCIAQYKTMEDLKRFLASGQYYLINSDIKLRVLDSVSKGT